MAASGDTVVMAGDDGTYQSPGMPALAELRVPNGVTLTGAPGQPRPIWYSASSEQAVTLEGFGEERALRRRHRVQRDRALCGGVRGRG